LIHAVCTVHRSTTHKNPKTARVHISSHSGASPRQQQQVSSPPAAGSVHPPMPLLDRDSQSGQACSSSTPGTCHTLGSGIWNVSAAAMKTSREHRQGQALDSPGMQQQQSPPEGRSLQQQQQQQQRQQSPLRSDLQQQLQPCDYAAVPFKLQHLRQEVLQEPAGLRGRAAATAGSSSSKQASCQPPPSALQGGWGAECLWVGERLGALRCRCVDQEHDKRSPGCRVMQREVFLC
jgi:hypothetical protein